MQRNIAGMRMPRLLAVFCWAVLLLAGPASAASYDFPAAMPAGCSGSNGSYTCSITSLSWGDTVSISGTKPASITFSGNLDLNSARINPSGSASDLTLVVRGRLRPGYQAVVNAAVQANEIHDADGAVSFGGSLRATAGQVSLGYQTSVSGNITVDAGNAILADQAVVRGHISASAQVTTAYRSQVGGGITAGSTITIGQETTVAGAIVAGGSANISIGYGATVVGDIRAHAGTVTLAQAAVAKACVQTLTSSRAVTLGLQATVAGVCCGNQGSCSNSCVRNNTTAAMPALCTVPNGSGLTGVYFNNMTLTDPASLKRVDGTVGFDWVNAAPATGVPADRFSIRWTGFVRVPVTGSYRFQTRSDDGVRLWVNSVQLVNNWTNHGATLDNSSAITLNAGVDYPITMEFYENGGQAVAALHWLRPGDAVYTIIPPGTADGGGLFTEEQAPLIASYDFNEASYNGTAGELIDGAGYGGGPFHGKAQGAARPTTASSTPAIPGTPGTCSYASLAGPVNNGPGFIVTGLPVSTVAGAKTTVAFWMYWSGSGNGMPIGWHLHDLWFSGANFGFNTAQGDVHGVPSASLAKTWRHVVAVFTNGSVIDNKLYIDGVAQSLTRLAGTPSTANAVASSSLQIGGWGANTNYRFIGLIDQVRVFNGELTAGQVAALHAETAPCPPPAGPHHLEIQHASGTGLTCTPSTVTVRACADAACSSDYTGGVTGTLGATGGSVAWPAGTAFSIPSGSGSTTISVQVTTTTPAVLGVASSTPAALNATSCDFGSPACSFTAADAGLLFDLPHHRSDSSQAFTVQAVRKSDNGLACTPAFANVTRSVTFRCSYDNPSSGSLPARVGGSALNASGSAAAACDGGGRAVSLAFNASGVASTSLQYADAGQLTLSATYTGGAATSDTGLVMSGSDSFIAAPERFTLGSVTAGPIRAGSSFSATVTARNANGAATPNFGRETGAETLYVGWARLQPTGGGAADGSFSGSFGSFANGSASATNLAWTEVGRGDLVVRSTNAGGYLGSGLLAYGSSAGNAVTCANENSTCALPAGTTATVYYGERGTWVAKAGQTGNVACSNPNFGDPLVGVPKKCLYVATSATNGSVGDVIPHRLSVAASHACGSFSYAGQPIPTTVTALNAAGNTTVNFNGTATTTPGFAQAVTLQDANGLGLGTLSGASIAASAFSAGVASALPSYAFSTKATAPQSLVLRASNGASGAALVSSAGGTEPTLPLRSGRLRLSNAFGKATAALQLPVVAEYWAGSAWLLNSADSCTALAGASVALANPRGATGAASAATTSAGALAMGSGNGSITLAAPTPAGSTLSLDIALNLGSTTADQSCNTAHPATTGAALPWLRAQNGSCAASADRDPAARASFGIFAPETRKTVHARDLY
jgi:MSHA biogenesis protein MshQ